MIIEDLWAVFPSLARADLSKKNNNKKLPIKIEFMSSIYFPLVFCSCQIEGKDLKKPLPVEKTCPVYISKIKIYMFTLKTCIYIMPQNLQSQS
jgi:hypothetical protein